MTPHGFNGSLVGGSKSKSSMFSAGVATEQSLFEGLINKDFSPSADDMVKAREEVEARRFVEIPGYHVDLFKLSDPGDRKKYETLMLKLIERSRDLTAMIAAKERRLLHDSDGSESWYAYVEWAEFKLHEERTAPVGTTPVAKEPEKQMETENE